MNNQDKATLVIGIFEIIVGFILLVVIGALGWGNLGIEVRSSVQIPGMLFILFGIILVIVPYMIGGEYRSSRV
ncbi:MAG: hypothetical protein ACFFED_09245 [Candidatus Thorarchaeota archaeon]